MKTFLFALLLSPLLVNAQTVSQQQNVYVPKQPTGVGKPVEKPQPIAGTGQYGSGKDRQYSSVGEKKTYDTTGANGGGRSISK